MRSGFLVFGLLFCACANGGTSPDAGDGFDGDVSDGDVTDGGDDGLPCGIQRVREDIGIPTVDGYQLAGFLDRPAQSDCPHYNYVVVDWRGSHGSKDLPHPGDGAWMAQDSYDAVEWIAKQPWSDGKVGTWGVSALCGAQYRTGS